MDTTTGKECQKSNHVGKKTNSSSNSNGSKVENGNAGGGEEKGVEGEKKNVHVTSKWLIFRQRKTEKNTNNIFVGKSTSKYFGLLQ